MKKIQVKNCTNNCNLVTIYLSHIMLSKNLVFVLVEKWHQVLELTLDPRNGSVRKYITEPDPDPVKNPSQF